MSKTIYKGTWAVIRREWKRMLGRPIYLFSSVFVMFFCYLFFLTFFSEGLPRSMPIGVVDMDHSYVSRTFIRNISAIPQADVTENYANYNEARDAMQRGKIYAFFVIDKNFEKELMSSQQPNFTFYVNDAYLVPGSLVYKELTYVSKLGSAYVHKQLLELRGVTVDESQILATVQPISIDAHLLANPYSNYGVYLINMLLPGILQMLVLLMTVFSIGYELKVKSTPDLLKTANNSMLAALMGKLIPYTILFSILGIGGNFILYEYMHFPMNGSMVRMSFATILYVMAYQAIGVFCIGLLPVLRDAISMVAVYSILGLSFTGFTFPIEAMPHGIQVFQHLFPIRFYFKIYVNEALNGAPIRYSIIYFIAIAAFFLLPFIVYERLKKAAINLNYPAK
ncbi:MAG: ABC transporter permease [Dysgonamonadaceae bacterium]|jgi:ABC-2 type transport system permease protein|nr:ABC transporter permease [Dysgonamonadaceae bacterium]MDD3727947.1 ABC transporter permease [Dysgonamonadaceae bacterium]MDD4247137.1 ABC transporter permease [Dysgonamonadaceae bacterium]MDD4605891.1 ABC transporter permease [Dysgonamonadaceae bacterium]